jgi:transposase
VLRTIEQEPNAENATIEEIEVAMEAAPNKRSYIRFGAIRLLLKGVNRADVCMIYNRSDRMVRLWIEMFNRGGIDALATKKSDGRPRRVKMERLRDLLVPVLEDPAQAGQRHWTGVKLHGWLLEQLQIDLGYRTVLRYLHQLNYNLRVPRAWPDRQDEEKRADFLLALRELCDTPSAEGKTVELWYGDEAGVEGDPRPRRRWTQRGSRPTVPYLGSHIRANVVGVVCPANGQCFTMIYDGVDTDVFQHFLDELAISVVDDPSKRRILIVDNASWHKSKRLNWHHFEPMYLPDYSPDFNPIERLWLRMKCDWFSDCIAKSRDELIEHLCAALNAFMSDPVTVASQCANRF